MALAPSVQAGALSSSLLSWCCTSATVCAGLTKHRRRYTDGGCAQPFKLGDRVSVSYSASTPGVSSGISGGWFEGVCEKVDLRYGRRHLIMTQQSSCDRSNDDEEPNLDMRS